MKEEKKGKTTACNFFVLKKVKFYRPLQKQISTKVIALKQRYSYSGNNLEASTDLDVEGSTVMLGVAD